MTVATETARNTYVGTGSLATYDYTFPIQSAADLRVSVTDTDGATTVLTNGADYTVTGALSPSGGTITLTAGNLASGYALAIRQYPSLTQSTDLTNQVRVYPQDMEDALDRLTRQVQRLNDDQSRSLRLPDTETGADAKTTIPPAAVRSGTFLAFDGSGNPMASSGGVGVAVSSVMQSFVAAASLATARSVAGGLIPTVTNIAALRAMIGADLTAYVLVAGYTNAGDGGGGLFRWVAADATPDNGGTIIAPTVGGGRFFRIFDSAINARWFGAKADGSTDDTTAFANSASAVSGTGSYVEAAPNSTHVVTLAPSATKVKAVEFKGTVDSRNIFTTAGAVGGAFSNYNCKAGKRLVYLTDENQTAISGGGCRDAYQIQCNDIDTRDYTAIGQKVTSGLRVFCQGAYTTSYQNQTKDLVGGWFCSQGCVSWTARGVSAIIAEGYQNGVGICSNEFAVHNPSAASGGVAQSNSMAAVQAIIFADFAAADATHVYTGVQVTNAGAFRASYVMQASGNFRWGIDLSSAMVNSAGIIMPSSAANEGTIIQYDTNDYTLFDRVNNIYRWIIGGAGPVAVTQNGIYIGSSPSVVSTRLFIDPSTTALSSMRMFQGVAPTSPSDGDMWYDGTNVKFRIGGTTKTFTLV